MFTSNKNTIIRTAYVVQDDVLYGFLTVRETLMLAAHFYLPSAMPIKDKVRGCCTCGPPRRHPRSLLRKQDLAKRAAEYTRLLALPRS